MIQYQKKIGFGTFLFLFCGILLLCGCTHEAALSSATQENNFENTPSKEKYYLMRMALPSSGKQEIAGDARGAYSIVPNAADFSAHTLYYDYATRQIVYLSNQVNVTNNAENPGWLDDVFGGTTPLAVNEKYYVIKYGKPPLPGVGYEGSPSFLLEMETNAANRKKLIVPQGKLLKSNTSIAADGIDLYLLVTDYDAAKMQHTDIVLCKTDFSGNRFKSLISLGIEKDTHIVDVYPQGVVLQRTSLPIQYAEAEKALQIQNFSYALQLYSLSENSLIETGFTWKQGELSFVLSNGMVYYVRKNKEQLHCYNLQTKIDTIVENNLLQSLSTVQDNAEILLIGNFYDAHLSFALRTEEETKQYSYSLESGMVLPLNLMYAHDGGEIPVSIAAESEQYFLVNNGMKRLNQTATGTDGTPYQFESILTQYALMQKDDYWNGVPNYLDFDDSALR